jgi:6-phosphogluconolactonase
MSEPALVIVRDAAAASDAAARHVASVLETAAADRGRADWALTGGSTVIGLYRALATAPLRDEVPWPRVHAWWGDDRFVPRDHPLSNVKPFDDILLGLAQAEEGTTGGPVGVPLPVDQVHPFRTTEAIGGSHDPGWAAAAMAEELRANGPIGGNGWPVFDLLTLGMGGDGHVMSVFPGSPAFDAPGLALGIEAPTHIEPHVARVTLNPAVVTAARDVLVVVTGPGKAAILADVLGPDLDVARWPAQLARRTGATWIVDEAAAALLPR